ncbi:MAG: WD40 repeat domain-containing protein [Acidimicrobiia bacterium]
MIEEASVQERLRRTYADIASKTALTDRALPVVGDESIGASRRLRRQRAGLLGGIAVVVCACVVAAFVFMGPTGRPHSLVEVSPTTTVPSFSPATGLTRLTLPGSATGYLSSLGPIAVTPDGSTAYVGGSHDGVVTPIDLRTGRALRPITVGEFPVAAVAITPNSKTAYVVEGGIADIVVPIDLATGTVGPAIHVIGPNGLGSSIAITPNGHMAYVSSLSEDKDRSIAPGSATTTEILPSFVVPIDLVTNTARRPIALEPLPGGGHTVQFQAPICQDSCGFNETIGGIAITPDGRTVYVSDTTPQGSGVFPIDVSTQQVGPMIRDGAAAGPIAITPDGRTAYVDGLGTVTPIDLATHTSRPAIHVPPAAPFSTIAITPDGRTLVGVEYPTIDLVDLRSGKEEAQIKNPGGGFYLAVSPHKRSSAPGTT